MQVENSDTFDTSGLLKILEQFQPPSTDPVLVEKEPVAPVFVAKKVETPRINTAFSEILAVDQPKMASGEMYSAKKVVQRMETREPTPLGQYINLWA